MKDDYHHGDLRRILLDEAAHLIDAAGLASLSMRELARRAGVSHAAPAHHFHDRRGLLTALAAQSLRMLADDIRVATNSAGFEEAAVAYVHFAHEHPGRYALMYRDDLLNPTDRELTGARAAAMAALNAGVTTIPEPHRRHVSAKEAAQVAWALVHGLASLPATRISPDGGNGDDTVRRAARQLFG